MNTAAIKVVESQIHVKQLRLQGDRFIFSKTTPSMGFQSSGVILADPDELWFQEDDVTCYNAEK